jgi:hypothetical protein
LGQPSQLMLSLPIFVERKIVMKGRLTVKRKVRIMIKIIVRRIMRMVIMLQVLLC